MRQVAEKFDKRPIDYRALLNKQYLDLNNSLSPHSDSESDLIQGMPISAATFGYERDLEFRHKSPKTLFVEEYVALHARSGLTKAVLKTQGAEAWKLLSVEEKKRYDFGKFAPIRIRLKAGSILVMGGNFQKYWTHGVPKMEAEDIVIERSTEDEWALTRWSATARIYQQQATAAVGG